MKHDPTFPEWTCPMCGHHEHRGYPRLDGIGRLLWPVAFVLLAVGIWRGTAGWVGGGVIAALVLPLGRLLGGVHWWGGLRCARCHHDVMLR